MAADLVVRLVTYDDTADLREQAVLNLDWRHHIADGSLDGGAGQRLRAALATASAAVKEAYGAREVTIAVKAHLPLAVALGHAFAQPTGCTLRIIRDGADWVTSRKPAARPTLKEERGRLGPVDAASASVEVSISRDVEVGANAYAAGHRYRHRVMLAPEDGLGRTGVEGEELANTWARQIGDVITRVADLPDVDRVDLFLAAPVEVAVLVGWWANAAGRVGLMNWTDKAGPYGRMWTLP